MPLPAGRTLRNIRPLSLSPSVRASSASMTVPPIAILALGRGGFGVVGIPWASLATLEQDIRKIPSRIEPRIRRIRFILPPKNATGPSKGPCFLHLENEESVPAPGIPGFAGLLEKFARKGLLLPILDGGGLFEVFALLPLADDAFFFDHALEALDRLLERLAFV